MHCGSSSEIGAMAGHRRSINGKRKPPLFRFVCINILLAISPYKDHLRLLRKSLCASLYSPKHPLCPHFNFPEQSSTSPNPYKGRSRRLMIGGKVYKSLWEGLIRYILENLIRPLTYPQACSLYGQPIWRHRILSSTDSSSLKPHTYSLVRRPKQRPQLNTS